MPDPNAVLPPRSFGRRLLKGCALGCGGVLLVFALVVTVLLLLLNRVPGSYPPAANPLPPPSLTDEAAAGLDGFESPYLGHTGSWDGMGGNLVHQPKTADLETEVGMGLRWTFMPVYWSAMEPSAPVDLDAGVPPAWKALDAFVVEAQRRQLNILMQAPVVGGNAGGPPAWAGRREPGKSAPLDMEALAAFAGKLARRYCPGGTLAKENRWETEYGVRAWELDNEPEMYFTHWEGQAGDYAEFVTLAAAQIRAADPRAVIVAPALASGKAGLPWLEAALDPDTQVASPQYRARKQRFALGPVTDVVSLHNYEGLDSAFSRSPRTLGQVLDDVRNVFDRWAPRSPGFTYPPKLSYWHTEGNFDFIGVLSSERRAAWRVQFFTRAFAMGLRKVCVMDADKSEQAAVRAYVRALPWPFPMQAAEPEVQITQGSAVVFRHPDGEIPADGQVWILWAVANTGDAQVRLPCARTEVSLLQVNGSQTQLRAADREVTVRLKGDPKMAPPVFVVDRPNWEPMVAPKPSSARERHGRAGN